MQSCRRKTVLPCVLLLAASCRAGRAQSAFPPPLNRPEAARLLREAREIAAEIADLPSRRALLVSILDAQEQAEDWNGSGKTLAALDRIGPAPPTNYNFLHPVFERAEWLAHQNHPQEAREILRNLAENAVNLPTEPAKSANAVYDYRAVPSAEWALRDTEAEQIKLHYYDDAIETAKRFKDTGAVSRARYDIFRAKLEAGDKAGALLTLAPNGDPNSRIAALKELSRVQIWARHSREAVASLEEAGEIALALPEGKPRQDALYLALPRYDEARDPALTLRLAEALTGPDSQGGVSETMILTLWREADAATSARFAAIAEPLLARITDKETRLQSARLTVMLRAWSGDAAGAAALGTATLGGQDPAPFVYIGRRMRACRNALEVQTWNYAAQVAAEIPNMSRSSGPIMTQEAAMQLFYRGLGREAVGLADCLPGEKSRLETYEELARYAGYAKDTDTLKALYPRLDPFVERIAPPTERADKFQELIAVYCAAGQSERVLDFFASLTAKGYLPYRLIQWGEWQAYNDPKAAPDTLRKAVKALGPVVNDAGVVSERLGIARALLDAGYTADGARLLAQVLAAVRAAPDKFNSDGFKQSLIDPLAQTGDPAGALRAALSMQKEPLFVNAAILNPPPPDPKDSLDNVPPSERAALKARRTRHHLLPRLMDDWTGAWDAAQKRKFLALAVMDDDKAIVLMRIAQRQATTDRDAALVTAREALPYIAKMPPGLEQTHAQWDAAKILVRSGQVKQAQALLQAASEEIIRVMKPDKQANWRLPNSERYVGTLYGAENEWEAQLLDIAEAQSEAGDLQAALKTLRPLHTDAMREFARNDNVGYWLQSPVPPRDPLLATKTMPPADRTSVLIGVAAALMRPLEMGPVPPRIVY